MAGYRQRTEALEETWLSPAAARSRAAQRATEETPCEIRTSFQRDRDRVIHSQAFRRLKSKTQVFLPPAGDHVRTRLTHTLEVMQISRTIARALRLNEDLTEAISLAHDLGHTPFGHAGETALASVFPGFRHNEQSLRVVDVLERDGRGLNLTDDVRDGILRHSKPDKGISGEVSGRPRTAEAQVVKISDGIAYINHDLDDALRAGMLTVERLPEAATSHLGKSHSGRINSLVVSVVRASEPNLDLPVADRQVIKMEGDVLASADELRRFLFTEVYAPINALPTTKHAMEIVRDLFRYYVENPSEMPPNFTRAGSADPVERRVADFVAGMTDQFASRTYSKLFVPGFEEV